MFAGFIKTLYTYPGIHIYELKFIDVFKQYVSGKDRIKHFFHRKARRTEGPSNKREGEERD